MTYEMRLVEGGYAVSLGVLAVWLGYQGSSWSLSILGMGQEGIPELLGFAYVWLLLLGIG